jgi:hypothetical protein
MNRSLAAVLAASVLATSGVVHAQSEPGIYGYVDSAVSKCSVDGALGQAGYEALNRQVEVDKKERPLLEEFEALNEKSTSTGNQPMYLGLGLKDNIRGTELSAQMKRDQLLGMVEDAYERDMRVASLIFADVEVEYRSGLPPEPDRSDPKSEHNLVYVLALAMRQAYDITSTDPKATPDQSRCSVDLALWLREAEPLQELSRSDHDMSEMKSRLDLLHAKYGAATLDPMIMSPEDRATYENDRAEVVAVQRVATFLRDIENLRLLVRASGLRREAYMHDLLVSGTDPDMGATMKARLDQGEFDKDTRSALGFQDQLSSLFPSDLERSMATLAKSVPPQPH